MRSRSTHLTNRNVPLDTETLHADMTSHHRPSITDMWQHFCVYQAYWVTLHANALRFILPVCKNKQLKFYCVGQ